MSGPRKHCSSSPVKFWAAGGIVMCAAAHQKRFTRADAEPGVSAVGGLGADGQDVSGRERNGRLRIMGEVSQGPVRLRAR